MVERFNGTDKGVKPNRKGQIDIEDRNNTNCNPNKGGGNLQVTCNYTAESFPFVSGDIAVLLFNRPLDIPNNTQKYYISLIEINPCHYESIFDFRNSRSGIIVELR